MKFQPGDRIVFVRHYPFSDFCPTSGITSICDLKGNGGVLIEEIGGGLKIKLDGFRFGSNTLYLHAKELGAIELEAVINSPLMKALR